MTISIISDLHLDPRRQGGTTLKSRTELADSLFKNIPSGPLIINGDLFDRESVSEKTLLQAYEALKGRSVVLVRGNHDSKSTKYGEICSLELLHNILPDSLLVWDKLTHLGGKLWAIPHMFDQESFEAELDKVPENSILLLHCNFDNNFAELQDHSLNLSRKRFKELRAKGCHIILGHEHAHKEEEGLTIIGCLTPTSISDCLGGDKFYLAYDRDTYELTPKKVWDASENFIELHYDELSGTDLTEYSFIRVSGTCSVDEFPQISRDIAKLRDSSDAFVVKNNVTVETPEREVEAVNITTFNILETLMEFIDDDYKEEISKCL